MSAFRFARKLSVLLPAMIMLAGAVGWATLNYSRSAQISALRETGEQRLELYAASLEREIDKYAYFPATLGLDTDVLRMLAGGQVARGETNRYLERLNSLADTLAIYVLDMNGIVVAASNWNTDGSFLGEDLSFRPYFVDAAQGRSGRFFGIGTTLGESGYYLSSPLNVDGKHVGVAAIKISLDQLELSWSHVEVPTTVTDNHGVVVLASVAEWKFKTLQPLEEDVRQRLETSLQYNARSLPPLGVEVVRVLDDGAALVRLPSKPDLQASALAESNLFLAQSERLPDMGWTLTVFSPAGQALSLAWTHAALATVATVLACILLVLWNQQVRYLHARFQAREALQRAHDELERKVEERTRNLHEVQEELIHAGKLAVIGQLSAELVHELSQPLAALSTLSGNAGKLMQRGDIVSARNNLDRIGILVTSMSALTSRLKLFARKSSDVVQPVLIGRVVENTLFLLNQRLRQTGTKMEVNVADGAVALCDANRLEQVFVNLLGNGLDAVEGRPLPRICIDAHRIDLQAVSRVIIRISDNGIGFDDEVKERLFEPFFTTKKGDRGLGLGLAISAGIVREFRGTLVAENDPAGGAVFTLELPAADL